MKKIKLYTSLFCLAIASCNTKPDEIKQNTLPEEYKEATMPFSPDSKFYTDEFLELAALPEVEIEKKVISKGYKLLENKDELDSNYYYSRKSYGTKEDDGTISVDCFTTKETKRLISLWNMSNLYSKLQSLNFSQTITNKNQDYNIPDPFLKKYGLKWDKNLTTKGYENAISFGSHLSVYKSKNMVVFISLLKTPKISNPNKPKQMKTPSQEYYYVYNITINVFS